jgi:hypothetical protein
MDATTDPDPFRYARDDARKRIHVTAQRSLSRDDFATVLARQVDEKTWSYGVLYDLRRMAAAAPQDDANTLADQLIRALIALGPRGPVAVVAWSLEVIESVEEYASSARRAGLRMRVFSTIADGERWLDEQDQAA